MRFLIFICLTFCAAHLSGSEIPLGYVSYSTNNIGDDIQAIAAKQFLPADAVPIDREFIGEFRSDQKINAVVNGWFMHQKNGYWDILKPAPEKSWPPTSCINPFFISIHFTRSFLPTVFSKKNVQYLKDHAPIGARDTFTLKQLKNRGIPSYFAGCLTLTLNNEDQVERNNIVYLVDLDQETADYVKSVTKSPTVTVTHGKSILQLLEVNHRLKYAEYILNLYRNCKCVVTTRLHAAMPCLAFKTPVFFVSSIARNSSLDIRFGGLSELTWNCSKEELINGEMDYDFDNPPPNSDAYLPIRENLVLKMKEWVQSNTSQVITN